VLRISVEETNANVLKLKLEGRIVGPWAAELRRVWKEYLEQQDRKTFLVDMTAVTFIDHDGQGVLADIVAAGAHFEVAGPLTSHILRSLREEYNRTRI
jgi:anti-anti-sigma regulatory factor